MADVFFASVPVDPRVDPRATNATDSEIAPSVRSVEAPEVQSLPGVHARFIKRFWERVRKSDSCWLWTSHRVRNGYGRYRLNGRREIASRISWMLHHGPIPPGLFVCHHCDNPPCVRPDHLFLGTALDNTADRLAKGRRNGLSFEAVEELRRLRTGGAGIVALARQFSVSARHVHRLISDLPTPPRATVRLSQGRTQSTALLTPPTARQQALLRFIESSLRESGAAPTVREMCAALHLASTNAVMDQLTSLERKGFIARNGRHRGIQVLRAPDSGAPNQHLPVSKV